MFAPEAVEPVVDFLAELAGDGAALELGIGHSARPHPNHTFHSQLRKKAATSPIRAPSSAWPMVDGLKRPPSTAGVSQSSGAAADGRASARRARRCRECNVRRGHTGDGRLQRRARPAARLPNCAGRRAGSSRAQDEHQDGKCERKRALPWPQGDDDLDSKDPERKLRRRVEPGGVVNGLRIARKRDPSRHGEERAEEDKRPEHEPHARRRRQPEAVGEKPQQGDRPHPEVADEEEREPRRGDRHAVGYARHAGETPISLSALETYGRGPKPTEVSSVSTSSMLRDDGVNRQ